MRSMFTMFITMFLAGCPAEVVPQPPREAPECLPPDAGADAGELCYLPEGSCRCEVPQ